MKKDTTYLVMKIHSAYAVLVDNDGRFIKAANKGYSVGDIVCDIIPIRYPAASTGIRAEVMAEIRFIPPRITNPASTAATIPVISGATPKVE